MGLVGTIVIGEPDAMLSRGTGYIAKGIHFELDICIGDNNDSFSVELAWICEELIDRKRLAHVMRSDARCGSEHGDSGDYLSQVSHPD